METEKRPRGRPGGKNFEFIKSIKLNKKQVDNWDSKRIKAFLEGKNLLKDLYEFMSNEAKCELKNINESDIDFLTKIKEMIS